MVAFNFSFISLKVSNKTLALRESKAPVGSSASISLGLLIKALAQAHLCFCPPLTS